MSKKKESNGTSADAQVTIQMLQDELVATKKTLASYKGGVATQRKTLKETTQMRNEMRSRVIVLEAEREDFEKTLSLTKANYAAAQNEISRLKRECEAKNTYIKELTSKYDKLQEDYAKVKRPWWKRIF